ncbi:MAG: hypothetical protein U1C49_02750 [Candidatus Andersenbacteria bacterium]|nr:hypothetical protein [bacterium]MDZ4225746.1 hypothetical protein [Candidatus Andersenbacteria bacterium]
MYERYINNDDHKWVENFLTEIQNQIPDQRERARFRGLLDTNNVHDLDTARQFFSAYQQGHQVLQDYLKNRADREKSREPIPPQSPAISEPEEPQLPDSKRRAA